jgi:hypothetical protein
MIRQIGGSKMQVSCKGYEKADHFRFDTFGIVRLLLGPGAQYVLPRFNKSECGNVSITHFHRNDSLELYLNRVSGDLCYCSTRLPVKSSIRKRDYLLLKNAALEMLSDYFNGRVIKPVSGITEATRKELEDCVQGRKNIENPVDQAIAGPDNFRAPAVMEGTASLPGEDDEKSFEALRGMRGIKGNRVLAAVRAFLDKPLRIAGSHYIFRGRNGKTYPISIHGDNLVGIGMLKKCLKKWEISPEEFLARV